MNYYTDVITKHYFDFEGRATRRQFWMFVLINILISSGISLLEPIFLGQNNLISYLYSLSVLLPSLGIAVRRLHDIGKSGWWLLIGFFVPIGLLILIVFYARKSNKPLETS